MSRGQLVPDDTTSAMLLDRLDAPDAAAGAILDGFPRTRAQAEALDAALTARRPGGPRGYIEVPDEELVPGIASRWICPPTATSTTSVSNPPRSRRVRPGRLAS